jgi:hypothetical protein
MQGRQLTEELQTPLERYNAEQERLDWLLSRNAITWEVYGRGVARAVEQIERAAGGEYRGTAALTEGSVAAASAITRFQREGELGEGAARAERLQQIMEQMRQEQARTRAATEEMAAALLAGNIFRLIGLG